MSAIDVLIAGVKQYKSANTNMPQGIVAKIDDLVAALTAIAGGSFSAPGGNAGGDLGGTYPNPKVVGIQTVPVSANAPNNGQKLTLVAGVWTPQ